MEITIDNKIWGLPLVEKHPTTVALDLVKIFDRSDWSLTDIHEVSRMIEQNPIIKEVVLDLLNRLAH